MNKCAEYRTDLQKLNAQELKAGAALFEHCLYKGRMISLFDDGTAVVEVVDPLVQQVTCR